MIFLACVVLILEIISYYRVIINILMGFFFFGFLLEDFFGRLYFLYGEIFEFP